MHAVTVVIAVVIAVLAEVGRSQNYTNQDDEYGITWMYFPDGDGKPQVMYLTEPRGRGRNGERAKGSTKDQVHFELYTRQNQNDPKRMQLRRRRDTDLDEFNSYYNAQAPTRVLIHGWQSSPKSNTIQDIKDAYLKREDCNIIAVDWSSLASNAYYATPAKQTKDVGQYTAEMIDYLCQQRGASTNSFHIVGHSLGAHTSGYAGAYTKSGRIPRITGLDPARPLFEDKNGPEDSLDKTDADFVDIIHTAAGTLGYEKPLGHSDFYPNNGRASQPGCEGIMSELLEACSHGRSHHYFAESINSQMGFYGYQCSSYESYKRGRCAKSSPNMMGEPVRETAYGVFYLDTMRQSPYAKGEQRR